MSLNKHHRNTMRSLLGLGLPLFISAAIGVIWLQVDRKHTRRIIPSEIVSSGDDASHWLLPNDIQIRNWSRTQISVLEDGVRLNERIESDQLVTDVTNGRFGIAPFTPAGQRAVLWFSASDDSNPKLNGREYELEIIQTTALLHHLPNSGRMTLTTILLLLTFILKMLWELSAPAAKLRKLLSLTIVALLIFHYASSKTRIKVELPSESISKQPEKNWFIARLPRWISAAHFLNRTELEFGGRTLKYVPIEVWESTEFRRDGYFTWTRTNPATIHMTMPESSSGEPKHRTSIVIQLIPSFIRRLIYVFLAITAYASALKHFSSSRDKQYFLTPSDISRNSSPSSAMYHMMVIGTLSILKLASVASEDVYAMNADPTNYSFYSLSIGTTVPIHPPGPSITALIARKLGIPWRLFIELFYCSSACILSRTLRPQLGSFLAEASLYGSLIFLPDIYTMFNLFGSESLLTITLMLLASLALRILTCDTWKQVGMNLVLIGLVLTYWSLCRTEMPLIVTTYTILGVILVLRLRRVTHSTNGFLLLIFVTPLMILIPLNQLTKVFFFAKGGCFGTCEVESESLMKLMSALYQIDSSETIKYAPVTRRSLIAACSVSPTMHAFRDRLLDPEDGQVQTGAKFVGRAGEPGPFLNWLLPGAFGEKGYGSANWLMLSAAQELESAFATGALQKRFAKFPIDPNVPVWIRDYPSCAFRAFTQPFRQSWVDHGGGGGAPNAATVALFDAALNRKRISTRRSTVVVKCRLANGDSSFDQMQLVDSSGLLLASSPFSSDGLGHVSIDLHSNIRFSPARLVLLKGNQSFPATEYVDFSALVSDSLSQEVLLPEISWCRVYVHKALSLRQLLGFDWQTLIFFCFSLSAVISSLLANLFCSSFAAPSRSLFYVLIVLAGWWISRSLLIGLVDAMLAWGIDRYMSSCGVLMLVCITCVSCLVGRLFNTFSKKTHTH
jgi:hypothetical protein